MEIPRLKNKAQNTLNSFSAKWQTGNFFLQTFLDKFIYLFQSLNSKYYKDYILVHLCLLIVNYMPDILEDAINVRNSPCFQEWQKCQLSTRIYALLLPGYMIPLSVSCGQMTKFLPTEYEKKSVPLLILNIKKLGMTPSCSLFPSLKMKPGHDCNPADNYMP